MCGQETIDVPATIINRGKYFQASRAFAESAKLWLTVEELRRATGWELKPQGFCMDDRCVPVPSGRDAEFRSGDLLNLAALARQTGQPLVRDDEHSVWSLGEAPEIIGANLKSLEAPNFTLPDLDGKMHSLADYRGKKILLMSWASW
jgi:hypothetical protein